MINVVVLAAVPLIGLVLGQQERRFPITHGSFVTDLVWLSPWFELTFIWVTYTEWTSMSATFADLFFLSILINSSAQYEVLQRQFEKLDFSDALHFKRLVEYHREIRKILRNFKAIYLVIIFVQFSISSIILCLICFQLSVVSASALIFQFESNE